MEPFIALGLKGADKVIDKHFHKVPHKYLYADTYKPKALKKRQQRKNSQDQGNSDSGSDNDNPDSDTKEIARDMQQGVPMPMPRDGSLPGGAYSQESPYITPPLYSHEPPRARPQYTPNPPPPPIGVAGGYYPPPPTQNYPQSPYDRRSRDRRRDSWDSNDDYYSDSYRAPRRPRPVTRRSSSYHGERYREDDDSYGQVLSRRGKNPSGSETVDRARHAAHRYGLKDELDGTFTTSKMGIAGSAAGALVAGWAADKAQVAYQKDGTKKDPNALVTLLGAAVGGLAINAIVEKYQESKGVTADEQNQWIDKWGGDKDGDAKSEGGRSQKGQRKRRDDRDRGGYGSDGGRSQRSRRRRGSAYGSDGGYD